MPDKRIANFMISDDPMDDRGVAFYFEGQVPSVGQLIDCEHGDFVVKAVRWQILGESKTRGGTAQGYLAAVVTVTRIHGYDRDKVEKDGAGHLKPDWWKPFLKKP